jgi:succinoglycan biosynthesis transport protein ExoP
MKLIRFTLILTIWLALGAVGGWFAYQQMPGKYVSEGEVALISETLSSAGLAQFSRISLMGSVDRELAAQNFQSLRVREHAAKTVGGITPVEITDNLNVKTRDTSAVISIKVSADSPKRAADIANALIDEAIRVDGEKREATARTALQAVGARLAEVRKELDDVNTRIRQFNLDKGIMISDENERQQVVALTIADTEKRLAELQVEQTALKSRLQQAADLIAAFNSKGELPSGFEFDDQERNYTLSEARRKLLDQESQLASLKSRYGPENPNTQAAQAEVETTKRTISDTLGMQRVRLASRLKDNEDAVKYFEKKLADTEEKARKTDISLDPVYVGLKSQREALQSSLSQLSTRFTELSVYAAAKPVTMQRFSDPYVPDGPSKMKIISALAVGLFVGGFLGLMHTVLSTGVVSKIQTYVAGK